MELYLSKYNKYPGSSEPEVVKVARDYYDAIRKRNSRRRPYIRSAYYGREKVFLTIYWDHLFQKNRKERILRSKLYRCGIDLVRYNRHQPIIVKESNNPNVVFNRFLGRTKDGELYWVQVIIDTKTKRKDLISIFPYKK